MWGESMSMQGLLKISIEIYYGKCIFIFYKFFETLDIFYYFFFLIYIICQSFLHVFISFCSCWLNGYGALFGCLSQCNL
jgi:hypothetical protein